MASLFTGTVEEYANFAAFPLVGVADTIYVAKDTNVIYRWDSTAYVVLSPNIIASLVFNDANGFDGNIALVGSVATLTITTALTTGSVGFIGTSGALLQDNANFFWDDTNNRLGLGTNAPTTALDVFGSGIIGRINGTSTNNAYLGFASAGTNKWSVGNVQSDHRFRIFSEANSAELVSVLQTGEFGIGIANPTTKFHIDGAASALIANLDANVSVAKSLSFRSDNSNRINLEVSGTESGSNVGADFFIRRYSDAGSLIDTPLTITRSTGNATFSGILITPQVKAATSAGLSINANSGTQVADFGAGGSANITFFGGLSGTSASFSSTTTATAFIPSGATIPTNGMYLSAANTLNFATNSTNRLSIASTGAATLSGGASAAPATSGTTTNSIVVLKPNDGSNAIIMGAYPSAPNANWIQSQSTGGLGTTFPLALQPIGGNVGINYNNPDIFVTGSGYGNLVVGNGSGETGMTIFSGTTGSSGIMFADGTSGSSAYTGYLVYRHTTDQLEIATGGGSVRLSIASTGAATFTSSVTAPSFATSSKSNIKENSGTVPASTATTIFTKSSGNGGGFILVTGRTAAGDWFFDTVAFNSDNSANAISSQNGGGPPTRTYSVSGTNLRLTVATALSSFYCFGLTANYV